MASVSYLDDYVWLGQCCATHSYQELQMYILNDGADDLTYCVRDGGQIYGYTISSNVPLTLLYQFPCYVVKFVFSNIDTFHGKDQERLLSDLCLHLRSQMHKQKGYYNLRIPSHIVDLLKAVNSSLENLIFCGGTVAEIYLGNSDLPLPGEGIHVFFANHTFAEEHRERIIELAFESFQKYQGQYHISPVTEHMAGEIYRNWIRTSLDQFKENSILIVQFHGEIVGFGLIAETETSVNFELSCVSEVTRGRGIYRTISSTLIRYALRQGKFFVTSTQLDNFASQATWGALGMRPFYSVYNYHYDNC